MRTEKQLMVKKIGLKRRRNGLVVILLSLALMFCGCGERGSVFNGTQDSGEESVEPGGQGNLVIKAENGDENVVYVAEKAEDRLQMPKGHYAKGLNENGTLWGSDGEGNTWGWDTLPEEIDAEGVRKIYASDDAFCILYAAQSDEILVTDRQGERKGSIAFSGGTIENIVGGGYVIYRFGEFGTRVGVCPLDIKNLKKGEDLPALPEDVRGLLEKGSDSENLYLYTAEMIYRYSLKEKVCYSVFSLTEAGLSGAINVIWKEGEDYYAVVYEGSGRTTYRISRKSKDELPKKKEIVIACLRSHSDLTKLVVSFNKLQDEYHVSIRRCQENDEVTSREDAYTRLNASLLGTDPPDLLLLDGIWYGDELAEHGYLEDLKPYLASGERIGMDDFYPEIITYGTCGDVLYTIPYSYQLDTILVPASEWDGTSGWTYTQMLEYLKGKEEYRPFGASYIMKMFLLQHTLDYFVDEERGEAHFDSPEFFELLAFMKECMEKEGMMDPDRRCIMQWTPCNHLSNFGTKGWDGDEEYVLAGFPNPDGEMRTILRGGLELAIVSTGKNKEGAWKFMEDVLSAAPAEKNLWLDQLLSNRNHMQRFVEEELALYGQEYVETIDEDGTVRRTYADHSITQACVDNFEKALAAGRKVSSVNMVLGAIIYEETDAYFSGAKSAEDVVEIIQNRVRLYLAENR